MEQGIEDMDGREDDSEIYFDEFALEEGDDNSEANSLDHLSEGEDEVAETRRDKASAKNVPASKHLKQRHGKEGEDNEHEDLWMEEH